MAAQRVIHGDDLLYRFLSELLAEDQGSTPTLAGRLVRSMAVWLPLDVYERWPVLLPFVVRDPSCRGNKTNGTPDCWGAPDARGYLRDDNSLVKALPKTLTIVAPRGSRLRGSRMGTEFVASHIWRVVPGSDLLASRLPQLNTFVPNLVWLPKQVAKLSDREGGALQLALQHESFRIYRRAPVESHLAEVVAEAWAMLPENAATETPPVDPMQLNWFEATPQFFRNREQRLRSVLDALAEVEVAGMASGKAVTSRYTAGLPGVAPDARRLLRCELERFLSHTNG